MAITLQRERARIYLLGDTYPAKDRIKAMGGHWDPDRRAWWVGTAKADDAQELADNAPSSNGGTNGTADRRPIGDDSRLAGKATYKGRSYYVLWMGRCKSGEEKAHLTTLDGKIDFWAALSECEITKTYAPREYRGRTEYTTLGSIRRFIDRAKRDEAAGRPNLSQYPRTGCSCGSREGIIQDTDCQQCRFDAE